MIVEELVKTDRREARERFAYFLLERHGFLNSDSQTFMETRQAVLEDRSPLELIYTGEHERGLAAVYTLLDGLVDDD